MSDYKLVPAEQSACPVCHGEGLRLNPLTEVPVLCANCNGGQQPECGFCGQTDRCDDDCDAVVIGGHRAAEQRPAPDVADYEQVLDDHRRLARELDVLLNGEEGAAKQASLCDLLGQLRSVVGRTGKPVLTAPDVAGLVGADSVPSADRMIEALLCQYEVNGAAPLGMWIERGPFAPLFAALAAHRSRGGE